MGESESGGGDVVDFLLYMFVLGPAVEWCLKSPRVNKGRPATTRGIALAVLLLAAVAGVKLSYELVGRQPNHFQVLGVRIDSPMSEIKRAYKQISLKHHPDKNPDDKHASEKFVKYQAAYEVLKDATKRDAYNKFGTAGIDAKDSDTESQLWSLSLFYIIWCGGRIARLGAPCAGLVSAAPRTALRSTGRARAPAPQAGGGLLAHDGQGLRGRPHLGLLGAAGARCLRVPNQNVGSLRSIFRTASGAVPADGSSRRGLWAVLPHCSATAAPRPDGHGRGASTWQPLG